jgi:hypothetical protein
MTTLPLTNDFPCEDMLETTLQTNTERFNINLQRYSDSDAVIGTPVRYAMVLI